jgi:hypothetical protein
MSQWRCADCGRPEDRRKKFLIEAVCHHCGKLLCPAHAFRVLDDAFHGGSIPASHCASCRRDHHPTMFRVDRTGAR